MSAKTMKAPGCLQEVPSTITARSAGRQSTESYTPSSSLNYNYEYNDAYEDYQGDPSRKRQSSSEPTTSSSTAASGPKKKKKNQQQDGEEDPEEEEESDKEEEVGGGRRGSGGKGPPYNCMTPEDSCRSLTFDSLHDLLNHMGHFHKDKNCCPTCEDKLVLNGNRWELAPRSGQPRNLTRLGHIKFFFPTSQAMKWHSLRKHIKPFQCTICPLHPRFERKAYTKHLRKQHGHSENDTKDIPKYTNIDCTPLLELAKKFEGGCTKDKLKSYTYKDGVKQYDCEDRTDKLTKSGGSREQPNSYDQYGQRQPRSESVCTLPDGNISSTSLVSGRSYGAIRGDFGQLSDDRGYSPLSGYPGQMAPYLDSFLHDPALHLAESEGSGSANQSSSAVACDRDAGNSNSSNNNMNHMQLGITVEEFKQHYSLTDEDCNAIAGLPWQQRKRVTELVTSFEEVSSYFGEGAGSESAELAVAKILNSARSQRLSRIIQKFQTENDGPAADIDGRTDLDAPAGPTDIDGPRNFGDMFLGPNNLPPFSIPYDYNHPLELDSGQGSEREFATSVYDSEPARTEPVWMQQYY